MLGNVLSEMEQAKPKITQRISYDSFKFEELKINAFQSDATADDEVSILSDS